jgi:hypothetical protein
MIATPASISPLVGLVPAGQLLRTVGNPTSIEDRILVPTNR